MSLFYDATDIIQTCSHKTLNNHTFHKKLKNFPPLLTIRMWGVFIRNICHLRKCYQICLGYWLKHKNECYWVLTLLFLSAFLRDLVFWKKTDGTTNVSEEANCQVVKPSHCVCKQINSPLSSLIPSESSVVSYYAVLHMAGRLPNPGIHFFI